MKKLKKHQIARRDAEIERTQRVDAYDKTAKTWSLAGRGDDLRTVQRFLVEVTGNLSCADHDVYSKAMELDEVVEYWREKAREIERHNILHKAVMEHYNRVTDAQVEAFINKLEEK